MAASKALLFPSEDALLAALTSSLIPAATRDAAAEFFRTADGAVGVAPRRRVSKAVLRRLAEAGVEQVTAPAERRSAACWPAIIAPRRIADDDPGGLVLLVTRGHGTLLALLAELLRLGCDRCAYQVVTARGQEPVGLVRATAPPYYTVARCGEPDAPYRAFTPTPSGQTRVWTELGFRHPLSVAATPAPDHLAAITGDGDWLGFPDGPWRDAIDLVDVQIPGPIRALRSATQRERLRVPLRLGKAKREQPPSLWVLRTRGPDVDDGVAGGGAGAAGAAGRDPGGDPMAQIDALARTLPDDVIARLLFAVLDVSEPADEDDGPDGPSRGSASPVSGSRTPPRGQIIALRARPGRGGPPAIDVAGTAFVTHLGIPNLYVPSDAVIEPPLRRETLRALLAPSADEIAWLAPVETPAGRAFRVERVPDDAFTPLSDWVEYLIHTSADVLAPWVRSAEFELASFQSSGLEWGEAPAAEPERMIRTPRARRADPERSTEPRPAIDAAPALMPIQTRAVAAPAVLAAREPSELERELVELERAFLDLEAAADAPARAALWAQMGLRHAALDRGRDAALAYTRALWDADDESAAARLAEWRAAIQTPRPPPGHSALWHPAQQKESPSAIDVRAAASHWLTQLGPALLSGAELGRRDAFGTARERHLIQGWLDVHDHLLDSRTVWLLRLALSRLAGGDPLALARTRDALLRRMQRGLSIERDVPTFLRFLGGAGGDSVAVTQLVEALDLLETYYRDTPRNRSAVEAPAHLTNAYVNLVLGYGFARLGRSEHARQLRQQALEALDLTDPVHGYLTRAYGARIDQALDSEPAHVALPVAVQSVLNAMSKMDRYRVDRLRNVSPILEPHENIDPGMAFTRAALHGETDPRGPEFAELRGMDDPSALDRAIESIMDRAIAGDTAADTSIGDRARLLDGAMDFFLQIPEASALRFLRVVRSAVDPVPLARRALLLEEALTVSGYLGAESLAAELAEALDRVVTQLVADDAVAVAAAFARGLRTLRRFGMTEAALRLLDHLLAVIAGETGETVEAIEARLHLAAALAHLDRFDRAEPIIAGTQNALDGIRFKSADERVRILRTLAQAWGAAPQEPAMRGLAALSGQLPDITDMFRTTNQHFCLSVVSFMEALVLGYARSDLALGETGRRWLDEDEYAIRRRIHRDFAALGTQT